MNKRAIVILLAVAVLSFLAGFLIQGRPAPAQTFARVPGVLMGQDLVLLTSSADGQRVYVWAIGQNASIAMLDPIGGLRCVGSVSAGGGIGMAPATGGAESGTQKSLPEIANELLNPRNR